MIGRLSGTIEHREADGSVVVDVNGVGYEVFLPVGTAGRAASEPGQAVALHIHTHVREDAMTLFGFATSEDRAAFRALRLAWAWRRVRAGLRPAGSRYRLPRVYRVSATP